MKDVELLILKSFVYSVMRQNELPETIHQQIQLIASSFNTRIAELDAIARSSPLLATDYCWAYSTLTSNAAEHKMGLSSLTADHDDSPAHEPSDIVSVSEYYDFEEDRKTLKAVTSRIDEARAQDMQQALSSKNPLQSLRHFLVPDL